MQAFNSVLKGIQLPNNKGLRGDGFNADCYKKLSSSVHCLKSSFESPDECSYRSIFVKIRASHTEFVLPSVTTQEQTGFMCGRFLCRMLDVYSVLLCISIAFV